jgi:hypothetical protein
LSISLKLREIFCYISLNISLESTWTELASAQVNLFLLLVVLFQLLISDQDQCIGISYCNFQKIAFCGLKKLHM